MTSLLSTRRPRGRPPVADDQVSRKDQVLCASLLLAGRKPTRIAAFFDVSIRTIYDWTERTRQYPEADALWRSAAGREWIARRARASCN